MYADGVLGCCKNCLFFCTAQRVFIVLLSVSSFVVVGHKLCGYSHGIAVRLQLQQSSILSANFLLRGQAIFIYTVAQ